MMYMHIPFFHSLNMHDLRATVNAYHSAGTSGLRSENSAQLASRTRHAAGTSRRKRPLTDETLPNFSASPGRVRKSEPLSYCIRKQSGTMFCFRHAC